MSQLPLIGHSGVERGVMQSAREGRLHHGWLIEGPSGIGKARLAHRLAIRLLGGDPDAEGDPVAQKVLAGNHPDLRWVSREADEKGKLPQDIPVAAARELNGFFQLRPALGGRRVGVIDSLDELNRFGANAILKTLEEPPPGGVLLLVTHGSRPVLPTIRSRCRRLRLGPLSEADTRRVLAVQGGETVPDAALKAGRPGLALRFASPPAIAAFEAADALVSAWPRLNDAVVAGFIVSAGGDEDAFEAGHARVLDWMAGKARTADGRERQAWSAAWLDVSRDLSSARQLAMDHRQVNAGLVERLQSLSSLW